MPHARNTDPQTSHDAAESVRSLTATKAALLNILYRALTDDELIDRYYIYVDAGLAPMASPSGIRSRRAELTREGLVEVTGETRKTASNRSANVSRITIEGIKAYENIQREAA